MPNQSNATSAMKKSILILISTGAISVPALSQGWRIAPTVGLNASAINYSSGLKTSLKSGALDLHTGVLARPQVGAYIDRSISERLSVRSGLLYTGKGGHLTLTSTRNRAVSAQASTRLSYLEIPLLLTVAIAENGLRLMGGPVLGVALGGKNVVQGSNSGVSAGSETTNLRIGEGVNDDMRPTDLSVSVGLVKQMDISDHPLEIGLHVQPSLSKLTPNVPAYPNNFAPNLLVGLRVAYLFELRR